MRFPQASTPAGRLQLATQAPAVFLGPGQGTAAPTWLHLSRLGPFSVWACACKLVNVSAQKLVSDHQRLCDFVSRSTALNTVGAAARCHSCRNQHHYLPTRKQAERDSKRGRGSDRYGREIEGERARERVLYFRGKPSASFRATTAAAKAASSRQHSTCGPRDGQRCTHIVKHMLQTGYNTGTDCTEAQPGGMKGREPGSTHAYANF